MKISQKIFFILSILIIALFAPVNVRAQTETPPEPSSQSQTGTVSGLIGNFNQNIQISESIEVMLHSYDQNYDQKFMLHGESEPDGTFSFPDITLEPGSIYAVMATYENVTYFSEPAVVEEGMESLEVDIIVYDSTEDLSDVQVDQLHVYFYALQGGLGVTEIYIISNLGEKTVKNAISLEDDGSQTSLVFPLPEDAANVSFNPSSPERFIVFPGGFADTEPIIPGEGSAQVVATYILPYTDGMSYTYKAPMAINEINFLLADEIGLALEGENLTPSGSTSLGDGSTVSIYSSESLQQDETIDLTLTGQLATNNSGNMIVENTASSASRFDPGIAVGGAILGVALVGIGIWWFRKPEDDFEEDYTLDELLREIAILDIGFEQEDLEEEEYDSQRGELWSQAKLLLNEISEIEAETE